MGGCLRYLVLKSCCSFLLLCFSNSSSLQVPLLISVFYTIPYRSVGAAGLNEQGYCYQRCPSWSPLPSWQSIHFAPALLFVLFLSHLRPMMGINVAILPAVTKDLPLSLPGSRLRFFLSRCKFRTLTTRRLMAEFYVLTFSRFPLRKKKHKS